MSSSTESWLGSGAIALSLAGLALFFSGVGIGAVLFFAGLAALWRLRWF